MLPSKSKLPVIAMARKSLVWPTFPVNLIVPVSAVVLSVKFLAVEPESTVAPKVMLSLEVVRTLANASIVTAPV